MSDTEKRKTAIHEAAHAVVAVALGARVFRLSIRPVAADGYRSVSLGHVLCQRSLPPAASDCHPESSWMRSWLMVAAAGYVAEQILWPESPIFSGGSDNVDIVTMLYCLNNRNMKTVGEWIWNTRADTAELLLQTWAMDECLDVAERLLRDQTMSGDEFYRSFYKGQCSAFYPLDPSVRCHNNPHPFGPHLAPAEPWQQHRQRSFHDWGCMPPSRPPRVSRMSAMQRNIHALNAGQYTRPLPRRAESVLAEFMDLSAIAEAENRIASQTYRYRGPEWLRRYR